MTQEELEKVFTEWKARYDADPEGFMDHEAFKGLAAESYGLGAARYFLELWAELSEK